MKKSAIFLIILALTALMLSACGNVIDDKLPADTGDSAAITESTVGEQTDPADTETEPVGEDASDSPDETEQTEDAMPENPENTEADAIPQGYVSNIYEGTVGQLRDNGNVGFKNHDESMTFGFVLPEDWSLDASVACVGDVKVFEIGGFFKTEELTADKVRITPEGTEFPTTAKDDEGGTVTIYAEEMSDGGVYDYMLHSSSVISNGEIYEKYVYIVSRGGYSVYVTFVVNDCYSEDICEKVLNSFVKN